MKIIKRQIVSSGYTAAALSWLVQGQPAGLAGTTWVIQPNASTFALAGTPNAYA